MFTMMITKHFRMCVQFVAGWLYVNVVEAEGVSLCYIVSPSQGVAD